MINISEKFEPLFNIPKEVDTFIITGGRNSQKSFATSLASINACLKYGHRVLYSRYTNASLEDSIYAEVIEKIDMLNYEDFFDLKQNRIVSKCNKSKIVFKGLKAGSNAQTANLKGLKDFSFWILDEAEELNDEDIYNKISISIRGNNEHDEHRNIKVLILNATTKEHFVYKRYFEDAHVNGGFNGVKDNVCYIHTTYLDCLEFTPKESILTFEYIKRTNPKKYNHVVLGSWLDKAEGVIFENWKEGEFDESLPFIFGADYGYVTDPSTLIKVAVDNKAMKLYVKECLYEGGLSTDELEREYTKHCSNKDLIIADNAEPRLIAELWDKGFNINPCQKGKDSIRNGIAKMQDYEIIVTPESHNIKKELNNYAWHDKKSNTPQDNYNHAIDAIRYAFSDLVADNNFFVA